MTAVSENQEGAKLSDAKGARELLQRFRQMIASAGPEERRNLMVTSSDSTVAVLAAWSNAGATSRKVNASTLSRFLGFIEGREQVTVPSFWETWLRVTYQDDASIEWLETYQRRRITDVRFQRELEALRIVTREGRALTVKMPRLDVLSVPEFLSANDVVISGNDVFVVDYHGEQHYNVYCFDLITGDQKWRTPGWGCSLPIVVSGSGNLTHVMIKPQSSRVLVFLAGPTGILLQAFDRQTGIGVLRFDCTMSIGDE